MRARDISAVLVFTLLEAGRAFAGQTCSQWTFSAGVEGYSGSASDALAAHVAWCNQSQSNMASTCDNAACGSSKTCTASAGSCTASTYPTFSCVMHLHDVTNSTGAVSDRDVTVSPTNRTNPEGCAACPASGTEMGGSHFIPAPANGSKVCIGGCSYTYHLDVFTVKGTSNSTGIDYGTSDGSPCGSDAGSASTSQKTTAADCFSDAGRTICADVGQKEATVNGDVVDPLKIPSNGCVSYASGGVACVTSGSPSSPPVPNSGTAGTPATPSATVVSNSVTAYYYDSTTVTHSSTAVTTVNPQGGNPNTTTGSSSGGGGAALSAANGDCGATGVNCTGDASLPGTGGGAGDGSGTGNDGSGNGTGNGQGGTGAGGGVCTFQECTQNLLNSVKSSPLYTTVLGVADAVPSGSCPSASFEIWGHSYDFMTSGCAMWADHVAPTLSTVMLVCWGLLALWIVLSA